MLLARKKEPAQSPLVQKILERKSSSTTESSTLKDPEVRWVDINSIQQWKDNPMGHKEKDVAALAKILQSHEQRSPVIVWRKNMTIYKGNGTHQAMKKLGKKLIKVQFEDFPSEAAAKAYGIADNKASELSDWDAETLVSILSSEEIKAMNPELGFTDAELRGLRFESDDEKINNMGKTDTGIKATIKIQCKPEDRDAIRETLKIWASDCGYSEVIVK